MLLQSCCSGPRIYYEAQKMNDSVVAKRKMKQKLTSLDFQYIYYYYILESYNHRVMFVIMHRPIQIKFIFHEVEYGTA